MNMFFLLVPKTTFKIRDYRLHTHTHTHTHTQYAHHNESHHNYHTLETVFEHELSLFSIIFLQK